MNPMRRILSDRQAAGLLAGLLAYLLIVQAALAGAACSMVAAPLEAGDTVICTLHGPEPEGGSAPSHDCQCQVGCQHCAPLLDVPAASGVAGSTVGETVWSPLPAQVARSARRISSGNQRAPPFVSV